MSQLTKNKTLYVSDILYDYTPDLCRLLFVNRHLGFCFRMLLTSHQTEIK